MKTACIFAGARGKSYLYPDAAFITEGLVKAGWGIIYGGSSKGVMGTVCSTAKMYGGTITGVLPKKVWDLKHFDADIVTLVGKDMAERKSHFWEKSDAFLCLPGGVGTLDELYEIWTLTKLGYMDPIRPIVVYNQNGFYDPLIEMTNRMIQHGTMPEERADLVKFVCNVQDAIDAVTK